MSKIIVIVIFDKHKVIRMEKKKLIVKVIQWSKNLTTVEKFSSHKHEYYSRKSK